MSLPVPVAGQEGGPQYAADVNGCMTIIDAHTHSPGSGVQITPDGLNINSSLSFGNNFAINMAALTLVPQNSVTAVNTIYETNAGDLHYINSAGLDIQITNGTGVAVTPTSIPGLVSPASVAYVPGSSTFVWQSNTSIAANMDFGSALLRNLSPNSTFALTLAPPTLSSNYTITLPSLPGSTSLMALDSSGNISAPYSISGGLNASVLTPQSVTATQIANNTITSTQIAVGGITTASYATASITNNKFAAANLTKAAGVSTFNLAATATPTAITAMRVVITTVGRPVSVSFIPALGNTNSGIQMTGSGLNFYVNRTISGTPTQIAQWNCNVNAQLPSAMLNFVDVTAPPGVLTYDLLYTNSNSSANLINTSTLVMEI